MFSDAFWVILRVAVELFGLMFLAPEVGYRLGLLWNRKEEADRTQLGTILGAILALLGLLLGFSFAAAGAKYLGRHELIVTEANAIGTAYLRADLLEEPHRETYRKLLKEYAKSRIRIFETKNNEEFQKVAKVSAELHPQLWEVAVRGVKQSHEFDETVLPPLNEVIDLHTTTSAAIRRHLPWPVILLLKVIAVWSLFMVGYGNAVSGRRHELLTLSLAFLVASVLWMTLDLDYPRIGVLQVNNQALVELYEGMK